MTSDSGFVQDVTLAYKPLYLSDAHCAKGTVASTKHLPHHQAKRPNVTFRGEATMGHNLRGGRVHGEYRLLVGMVHVGAHEFGHAKVSHLDYTIVAH